MSPSFLHISHSGNITIKPNNRVRKNISEGVDCHKHWAFELLYGVRLRLSTIHLLSMALLQLSVSWVIDMSSGFSLLWLPPPNFFDDFMFVEYIFAILFLYMIISLLWCPNLADTSNKHNILEFNKQINIFLGLTTVFNLFFTYGIINFLKETGKLNTSIKHDILGFNNKSNLGFNIKSKTNYLRGTWNFEYERTYLKVKSKYWENIGREIIEA